MITRNNLNKKSEEQSRSRITFFGLGHISVISTSTTSTIKLLLFVKRGVLFTLHQIVSLSDC